MMRQKSRNNYKRKAKARRKLLNWEPQIKAPSVPALYALYKKTPDADIREHLKTVLVVMEQRKKGCRPAYYPITKESLAKISEKPRGISLTFDVEETCDKPIKNLRRYKSIIYLVKSSSRFFLKPDIGEIFDQINPFDLPKIKAICFISRHELLPDTEGEHFLMPAKLLIEK